MQIHLECNILHMYTVGTNMTDRLWHEEKKRMMGREMTTVQSVCTCYIVKARI